MDGLPGADAISLGVDNPALALVNPTFLYGWLGNGKKRCGAELQVRVKTCQCFGVSKHVNALADYL